MFGYSGRRSSGLHAIAAARVARARQVARDGDVLLLSGTPGEVTAMQHALQARPALLDPEARHTADTAVRAAALSAQLDADGVVTVTSWWHEPRARLLVRLALGRRRLRLAGAPARGPWSVRHLLRELACFPFVPLHLGLARWRTAGPYARPTGTP